MNESSDDIRSAAGKHTGGTAADDVVLQEAEQLQDKAQPQHHTALSKIGAQLQRSGQPKNSALSKMSAPVKNEVQAKKSSSPYLRAENEDDDGCNPFSDRPAEPEPLFQRDPWN